MRGRQQGFALLIAIGVVALATVTAVALVATLGGWVKRSELQTQQSQATELARAGVEWARSMLFEDRRLSDVHYGERRPCGCAHDRGRHGAHEQKTLNLLVDIVEHIDGDAAPLQMAPAISMNRCLKCSPEISKKYTRKTTTVRWPAADSNQPTPC